jgi:predicted hydrocarbon binding protein
LKLEDNEYYVVFDKCYCPLMQNNLENASKTICYCTLGNLKHKFKISLGREVEVEMLKTVLAGDKECRFKIKV